MERSERQKPQLVANQPYDETLDINDSEEVTSLYTPTPRQAVFRNTRQQQPSNMANSGSDEFEGSTKQKKKGPPASPSEATENNDEEEEEDSDETESDEDDGEPGSAPEGAYDPSDYDHVRVTSDIKELFQYITRYTPQTIELDHKLKPFIPDFIPAVGDIDAFLKVPRPDGKVDGLGFVVLDEPCVKQSDPTVLSLWLSENTKQHNVAEVKVKSIDNPQKNPKVIDNWIESISELHRSKPPATVHYTRPMPDIDTLMQEWPPEFEELLGKVSLPTADINCDLAEYIDIICGILDIPVYKNRIQSLHVLFTLYTEFKNSQHFKNLAEGRKSDMLSPQHIATTEAETLTQFRITLTMPGGDFFIIMLLLWTFVVASKISVSYSPGSLTLKCDISDDFELLQWFRNDLQLQDDQRFSLTESNKTTQVFNLISSDCGTYTCQISNEYRTSAAFIKVN
ncbi:hypothetical protein QTP70_020960, partial [Hemibagrus guttatus]